MPLCVRALASRRVLRTLFGSLFGLVIQVVHPVFGNSCEWRHWFVCASPTAAIGLGRRLLYVSEEQEYCFDLCRKTNENFGL